MSNNLEKLNAKKLVSARRLVWNYWRYQDYVSLGKAIDAIYTLLADSENIHRISTNNVLLTGWVHPKLIDHDFIRIPIEGNPDYTVRVSRFRFRPDVIRAQGIRIILSGFSIKFEGPPAIRVRLPSSAHDLNRLENTHAVSIASEFDATSLV